MPNYRETPVNGTSWVRSNRIIIDNPYNGMPTIQFLEESVVEFNGETFIKYIGDVKTDFSDPQHQFDLISPIDDSVIASAKYVDVQVLLYSLYRHLTNARDNAQ